MTDRKKFGEWWRAQTAYRGEKLEEVALSAWQAATTDTTTPADDRKQLYEAYAKAELARPIEFDDFEEGWQARAASQPAQEPVEQSIFDADNMAACAADTARQDRILQLCGEYAMAYRNAPIADAEKAWKKLEREVRKP
jgi:hypothetical protein